MLIQKQINSIAWITFGIVVLIGAMVPEILSAASLSVSPVVIDMKAHARDLVKETVTLRNTSGRPVEVYPFVYGISSESGQEEFLDPSKADINTSLSNWIEVSRSSILIQPGKQTSVEISVNVNLTARSGFYHARIVFAEGATRDEAEKRVDSSASVIVNLEVLEDIRERAQLLRFTPERTFFFSFPVTFVYTVENIGNRSVAPYGKIRIYNRGGREVATVPLNAERREISPDAKSELNAAWNGNPNSSWLTKMILGGAVPGRYKAMLDLAYGAGGQKTLQDSAIFWIIPLRALVLIVILLLGLIFAASRMHRYLERRR